MLSEVPEGWISAALGDVCAINMGQSPKSSDVNGEQLGLPFLQGCAEFGDYVPTPKAWITKPLKVAEEGDILFSVRAPVGKMNIAPVQLCIGRGLCAINSKSAEQSFLKYLLAYITPNISSQSQGSTFQAVNKKQMHEAPVLLPPLNEQQRIAEILSSVDASIQATQAVIEQAERVKRGLMEQLLTGGLGSEAIARGDVPEGWQSDELKECLCKIIDYRGKAPPKAAIGIPLITAKNIRKGFLSFAVDEYIDAEQYNDWMTKGIPQAGDVMFTTEAPLGNVALFPSEGLYALGQRVITLRCNERLESSFLFYLLQSKFMEAEIQLRSTGSTAKGIKSKEFQKIKVPIPTIEEQLRTARILASFDASITEQKRILQQYAQTKRGLMDDLLTGKVRTV